jgi:lipoate-protein ligase B
MPDELCDVHLLGRMEFERAWRLQESMAAEIAAGSRPPSLLLVEHPHTYTFGRRGQAANLLWDEAELARREIAVHWIDRGGDVTYHGPGQLVGYPLLHLAPGGIGAGEKSPNGNARLPQADFIGYLRRLEAALIAALARFGLAGGQRPGLTGVWVQEDMTSRCVACPPEQRRPPAKIAAIGVKVDARGVSRHGFALNVAPDMSYWEGIIGCGLPDSPITSMERLLGTAPAMDDVLQAVIHALGRTFNLHMRRAAGFHLPSPGGSTQDPRR